MKTPPKLHKCLHSRRKYYTDRNGRLRFLRRGIKPLAFSYPEVRHWYLTEMGMCLK